MINASAWLCVRCRGDHGDGYGVCKGELEPMFVRDDLVRAVLAQQWMAMIQMRLSFKALGDLDENGNPMVMKETMWRMKRHEELRTPNLLCAVDVVAEMLGEA